MKFCKDCKHYQSAALFFGVYSPSRCSHPSLMTVSLETGVRVYKPRATTEPKALRESRDACDVEAKWFEPKEINVTELHGIYNTAAPQQP